MPWMSASVLVGSRAVIQSAMALADWSVFWSGHPADGAQQPGFGFGHALSCRAAHLQQMCREIAEAAPFMVAGVGESLMQRPAHGDADALWMALQSGYTTCGGVARALN